MSIAGGEVKIFFINRFGFIPIMKKSTEENRKLAFRNKPAEIYFNECNNMVFYDLSRNKEALSAHTLTSSLGLSAKLCPQKDTASFKSAEDMTERLRRNA